MTTSTLYLTVGTGGGIWNGRPDGSVTLYKENTFTGETLYQIASNHDGSSSTFTVVVVGEGGSIFNSARTGANHGTWNKVHSGTTSTALYSAAFGILLNPIWVAGGANNTVLYSPNSTNWYSGNGAVKGAQWTWAAFGNGQFIMVGNKTVNGQKQGAAQMSTNGVDWVEAAPGTKNILQSVAYSPDLNVFVAVGDNGAIVSVNA